MGDHHRQQGVGFPGHLIVRRHIAYRRFRSRLHFILARRFIATASIPGLSPRANYRLCYHHVFFFLGGRVVSAGVILPCYKWVGYWRSIPPRVSPVRAGFYVRSLGRDGGRPSPCCRAKDGNRTHIIGRQVWLQPPTRLVAFGRSWRKPAFVIKWNS